MIKHILVTYNRLNRTWGVTSYGEGWRALSDEWSLDEMDTYVFKDAAIAAAERIKSHHPNSTLVVFNVPEFCEACDEEGNLQWESSRTAYETKLPDNHPDNPNRDTLLCRSCAQTHHDYWDSAWADYNAGRA